MSKKKDKIPVDEINRLAEILKDQDLTEIEIESDDFGLIRVRRETNPTVVAASAPAVAAAQTINHASAPELSSEAGLIEVTSPMVGTFYRSSSPGAEPFVSVGDIVKKGQTLCIVEAMKLMNELPAEVDGEIVEICVNDAEAISFGQILMKIRPA